MLEWIGWALALVLAIGLGYHMRNLRALSRWLEADDGRDPPRMMGAWDRFHALLHRSRREAARREAQLADQVARWREAARALPDGVVILEGDRIAWCNDTAATPFGIDLAEARFVPDVEAEIVAAVNALRTRYSYVFTTGGIGPTHDDITADAIGAAFGLAVEHHPDAMALLSAR